MIRAIFFDAGNTLLSMNYRVIATELGRQGVRVTPDDVRRAEWLARVRLDEDVFARSRPETSTESRSSAERYVRYVLDELRVHDEHAVPAVHVVVDWGHR